MNLLTRKIFTNQKMKKKELRHMEILNEDQTESKFFMKCMMIILIFFS